jgi:hypothetical protein
MRGPISATANARRSSAASASISNSTFSISRPRSPSARRTADEGGNAIARQTLFMVHGDVLVMPTLCRIGRDLPTMPIWVPNQQ